MAAGVTGHAGVGKAINSSHRPAGPNWALIIQSTPTERPRGEGQGGQGRPRH